MTATFLVAISPDIISELCFAVKIGTVDEAMK